MPVKINQCGDLDRLAEVLLLIEVYHAKLVAKPSIC